MNPATAPLRRRSIRLPRGALCAGMLIVIGLIAAVAGWGSSQRLSLLDSGTPVASTPAQVAKRAGHPALDPAPSCGKREQPASDPTGALATPPRAIGDQLVTHGVAFAPEFAIPQQLSIGKQPRAPTLPVAAPHLTTVLII
ncbi:hypothetical protein VMT65_00790 [Nocardia sp. CDC153]|uniref:hypothetical protein n=1 Tax=Nocardia sp. CDC153 TaxID=3112167 RepID=UPI002DBFAC3C|nr:hypothetical protein [Nocardia sp. CDC153]MEC3951559.1 hypothetical protein [Nocardia sp. CDC153]